MFAVGLILIILAVIVLIYVIFATADLEPMSIDWGVFTADLTPLQLFFLGAVTVLVLSIGSVMLSIGLKSQGEKRAEVKRLRKEVNKTHDDQSTATADPSSRETDSDAASPTSKKGRKGEPKERGTGHGTERDSAGLGGQTSTTTPLDSSRSGSSDDAAPKSSGPSMPPPPPPESGRR